MVGMSGMSTESAMTEAPCRLSLRERMWAAELWQFCSAPRELFTVSLHFSGHLIRKPRYDPRNGEYHIGDYDCIRQPGACGLGACERWIEKHRPEFDCALGVLLLGVRREVDHV